jgi:hypothetical protein
VSVPAAHCFYDESSLRLYDRNLFKVAVGKYTRDWDVQEANEQRSDVSLSPKQKQRQTKDKL